MHDTRTATSLFDTVRARPVLSALLLIAAASFWYRGIARTFTHIADFETLYLQARTWLYGGDPYDWNDPLMAVPPEFFNEPFKWLVYPPPTLALLAPFGALPWELASVLFIVASLLLYAAMVMVLGVWYEVFHERGRALVFLTGALAMYPIHTALAQGQIAVPAAALMILALYAEFARGRPLAAAALGALALCLKPHVGGVALGYVLLRRRFRTGRWMLAVAALIAAVGILPLVLAGHPAWFSQYFQHQPDLLVFGQAVPRRHLELVVLDLNNILRFLGGPASALWLLRGLAVLGLLGLWWLAFGRRPNPDDRQALLPILTLSLLAIYHKPYDAVILLPLLGWLTAAWGQRPLWQTVPVAGALLPFVQPLPTTTGVALWHFAEDNPIRAAAPRLWELVVVPHATWALLFLTLFLCLFALQSARADRSGGAEPFHPPQCPPEKI